MYQGKPLDGFEKLLPVPRKVWFAFLDSHYFLPWQEKYKVSSKHENEKMWINGRLMFMSVFLWLVLVFNIVYFILLCLVNVFQKFTVNFVCHDFGFIPCFTCSPLVCQIGWSALKFKENVYNVLFGANTAYVIKKVDLKIVLITLMCYSVMYTQRYIICLSGRQIPPVLFFLMSLPFFLPVFSLSSLKIEGQGCSTLYRYWAM